MVSRRSDPIRMNDNTKKESQPELVEFTVGGRTYLTTLTEKFKKRKVWTKPDEKQVISHIPGTVHEVFIREGDRVKAGDRLMVVDAMKMLNIITSTVEGKVKNVYVKAGDKIAKGKVMLEFEG